MARELSSAQLVERSIIKTYRKTIWNPFVQACQNYRLIEDGDHIAVKADGTAASVAMALCLRHLQRISETAFTLSYSCSEEAKPLMLSLGFDLTFSDDANKTAVATTLSDVVENTVSYLFEGGALVGTLPKEEGIIRPLFCVNAQAIRNFREHNALDTVEAPIGELSQTIERIKEVNPDFEHNVFTSLQNVKLDTIVAYQKDGETVSFLDNY